MASDDTLSEFAKKLAEKYARPTETYAVETQSGHMFVMKPLSGKEQKLIDSSIEGVENQSLTGVSISMTAARVAASIVSIDGVEVPDLASLNEINALLDLIDGKDLDELNAAYSQQAAPKGEALKKSSTLPETSEPLTLSP